MINGIVFDFGGVVQKLVDDRIKAVIKRNLNVCKQDFDKIFDTKLPYVQKGHMTEREFLLELGSEGQNSLPDDCIDWFIEPYMNDSLLYPEIAKLLDLLVDHDCTLSLLSNTIPSHINLNRSRGNFHWFGDNCFLSCETGKLKPEPDAYSYVSEELGIPLSRLLLIDDSSENVNQAGIMGMNVLLHKSETTNVSNIEISLNKYGVLI